MLRRVPVVVILGSTGTGKTKLSIELAEKFGGEVISADSMQVYSNLDIVTAKATKNERSKIVHHMLDVADPKEPFTVLQYRNLALPIMNSLISKDMLPIVVGGTNYYIESLLWDILISPPSSPGLSSELTTQKPASCTSQFQKITELELEHQPSERLHDHLKQIDPVTASRLHPNNKRKIQRALEVYCQQGIPLSAIIEEQRNKPGGNRLGGPLRYPHTIILWLQCNQDILNTRLNKRVNSMLEQGLIRELRNFYETYVKNGEKQVTKGILQTIGLKEFLPYLEKHDCNCDRILENYLKDKSYLISDTLESNEPEGLNLLRNCLEELKLVTIRYSKKQLKWINNRFLGYKDRQVPQIYQLNTSDVESWDKNVYDPAVDIIESYMKGHEAKMSPLKLITHPSSGLNEEVLNFCNDCNRYFVGEFQWKLHLKSNKHKKVKEGNKKRVNREKSNSDVQH